MAGMSSRIGSGLVSGGPTNNTAMAPGSLNSTNHVVPNLQSMRRSSPNSSSQYSQWRIQKDLGSRCSWKFAAIFFVLLSVILVSALIYTTGKSQIFPENWIKKDDFLAEAMHFLIQRQLHRWGNFPQLLFFQNVNVKAECASVNFWGYIRFCKLVRIPRGRVRVAQ